MTATSEPESGSEPCEDVVDGIANCLEVLEVFVFDPEPDAALAELRRARASRSVPVLGITGTGGAGKSSLTDEIVRRFRLDQSDAVRIGLISIDPSRKRTGGALLGDRIRMNAIGPWSRGSRVYMRSLATRDTGSEVTVGLPDDTALAAFGDNLMDPTTRPPAARAGYAQGRALADELRAREMPDGRQAWPSAMGTTGNTVTPPPRPGLTAEEREKLADVLGDLVNWLRSRG